MQVQEAGLRAPDRVHVRIYADRPWTTDAGLRLKSGAAWPNAPVYQFPGGITWATALSDGGKLAVGTATAAQTTALAAIGIRGPVQISDPVTGRVWCSGAYEVSPTNAAGGEGLTPWDGIVISVTDHPAIGGGGETPDATTETKGKVRLAGDLGGTADAPTVPGLAGKVDTTDPRLSDARPPLGHDHTAAQIADATTVGRSVLTAASQSAARSAIGAGTSSLAIGTTSSTAAAGDRAATETAIGMIELATTAEVTAGTDTVRAVTPARLKERLDSQGDLTPVTTGQTWSGAVDLTTLATGPRTIHATLTGNVTVTLPTPNSAVSHTVTLVLTQDGTGSRTVSIPGVKWAWSTPFVHTGTASSTDIVHLLWTGAGWVGLPAAQKIGAP